MHSMNESESGSLMAQWRASGGAIQAHAFEAPSGDEGLAAVQFTTPMHPYAQCSGDDGLQAGRVTGMHTPGVWGCGDDGLAL
jgi:hypothetical protein